MLANFALVFLTIYSTGKGALDCWIMSGVLVTYLIALKLAKAPLRAQLCLIVVTEILLVLYGMHSASRVMNGDGGWETAAYMSGLIILCWNLPKLALVVLFLLNPVVALLRFKKVTSSQWLWMIVVPLAALVHPAIVLYGIR